MELNDIWLVNPDRSAPVLAAKLKESFHRHHKNGKNRPLARAIAETFKKDLLIGAAGALMGNMFMVFMPFVVKYLIAFAGRAYIAQHVGGPSPHIGEGVGLVVAITVMQIISSICNNQFMYRGMVVGGQSRAALISLLFEKALTISGRAKAGGNALKDLPPGVKPGSKEEKEFLAEKLESEESKNDSKNDSKKDKKKDKKGKKPKEPDNQGWSNGRIVNLMSVDTYRIDQAFGWFHMLWVTPIMLVVTIVLLLINLTYSALVGIALFFISVPVMGMAVRAMFQRRRKVNKITDQRITLIQEVFQAIRFVKFYSWETNFLERIHTFRKREIRTIQVMLSIRNAIMAIGISIPTFASMLAFVTFSLTNHPLNPAPVFSSLALFNLLRMPLTLLPMVLGLVTDALASIDRIEKFLLAEDGDDTIIFCENGDTALELRDAEFTWEQSSPPGPEEEPKKGPGKGQRHSKGMFDKKKVEAAVSAKPESGKPEIESSVTTTEETNNDALQKAPFRVQNLNITINRGEFVAIVGGVGSGKSSLLSAIAGEMRQTYGKVMITGTRAFCTQSAWIQNATVQDNITFGKPYDKQRFNQVVEACSLRPDLEALPNGSATEIGERGINLSGGQKQRVNLARAIYFDADVILMDDPLSAVDAHVGRHILEYALCGLLKDKCRVLATHQLHVLYRCDRIIMMNEGQITAYDTFANLMANNVEFQRMMDTVENEEKKEEEEEEAEIEEKGTVELKKIKSIKEAGEALMQDEDRAVKGVSFKIYIEYFKATGSVLLIPLTILILIIAQGAQILTNLWLAWWTSNKFQLSMGVYVSTLLTFLLFYLILTGFRLRYTAVLVLHNQSLCLFSRS